MELSWVLIINPLKAKCWLLLGRILDTENPVSKQLRFHPEGCISRRNLPKISSTSRFRLINTVLSRNNAHLFIPGAVRANRVWPSLCKSQDWHLLTEYIFSQVYSNPVNLPMPISRIFYPDRDRHWVDAEDMAVFLQSLWSKMRWFWELQGMNFEIPKCPFMADATVQT